VSIIQGLAHKRMVVEAGEVPNDYIAYYPLDTNSLDETGNYDGTDYGVTYDGSSAVFDGVNDRIQLISNVNSFGYTDKYTYSVWFNTTVASWSEIVNDYYTPTTALPVDTDIRLSITGTGTVWVRTTRNSVNTDLESASTYNDGNWHNATYVVDASTTALYVDGVVVDTGSTSYRTNTVNDRVMLGSRKYDNIEGLYFNGKISNLKIYNRALCQEEITSLYNEGY